MKPRAIPTMRAPVSVFTFAIVFAAMLFSALATRANAEDLVSGLSQDTIHINSNYTGTDIVVFGAIEAPDLLDAGSTRDVVVVVRGPSTNMIVRRKARIAGIWINRDEITLDGMPSYYFSASTRPISQIASSDTLQRYQLGVKNLYPRAMSTSSPPKGEPFRKAAIRDMQRQNLYAQRPNGVEFLSYSLFRVRVPVPANVPRGQYTAEVYLFRNGTVMSAQSTPLFVDQIGLERKLFNFAHHWPLFYGLATVMMAMLMGWLSSLVVRLR